MLAIAVAGFIGTALVASTREDAFDAAGRQSKLVWVALMGVSSLAVALGLPILSWVGMVIIGMYWWDVRPQIKGILDNAGGW